MIGYYSATEITTYWGNKIVNITSIVLASLFLTGFSFKNLPKKVDLEIYYKYLFPISFGIIGLCLLNYFIPALVYKLMDWNFNNDILKSITNLPRFLIMMVLSVFLEELYYRRIIAQKILNEKGFRKSIWLSALAFCIGHFFSSTGLLSAFLGGLVLGYIFLKTKSLMLSFIAHLIYNYTTYFGALKLNENTNLWNSYLIIYFIILIGLLMIAIMFYIIKKWKPKVETESRS
ncbi:CPBP family intramembrane glutamic endopeptidase [Flavobacterium dankookense]|uniref:CPBP family intramembrane glutamic endopeptidase n=1 Tax=Flavobacterium dankookense TaxID=706186 RepID=UPI0013C33C59|nr:CPBP family intramembrane glutamic endopeptidase [Flavobacterium dankookense]